MPYIVKARFYAEKDNFGESYVITSDNQEFNTNLEVGRTVEIFNAQPQEIEEQAENVSQQTMPGSEASTQISAILERHFTVNSGQVSNVRDLQLLYVSLQNLLVS